MTRRLALWALPILASTAMALVTSAPAVAQPIPGTTCALFPATSIFNTDISAQPVSPQSATWKANMAQHTFLHPDLGTVAQQYGIPINVAPPPTSGLTPSFLYDSESDHPAEGYPIDQSTLIEGGPGASSGSDRHALVVEKNLCKLYELYNLQNFTNGQTPQAGSGAVWDLSSNAMRPNGWTSADAAGLPMAPLLLRSDEILAGSITHAIRFTAHCTHSYIWPGSHGAGLCGASYPPMGARFRLSGSFNIAAYSASTQVVLRAFQHYGLLLADNGSDWYFGGTTDDWWGTAAGDTVVSELKTIPASAFDAVDESSLQVAANSYQSAPPARVDWFGGLMKGGPAVTGSATTEEVFVRGMDNALWSSTPGGAWTSRGGVIVAPPGAAATSASSTDVFVEGGDTALWHAKESSGAFGPWGSLGGVLTAGPGAAAGFGANRVDVFVRGGDAAAWWTFSTDNGVTFGPWARVGGLSLDTVAAAAQAGAMDVYVRGGDSAVWWNRYTTAGGWTGWRSLGGRTYYAPAASSCATGHLDVWVVGADGQLWRRGSTDGGSTWGAWSRLGGAWTANPSAFCHPSTTNVDIFGRGPDGGLWRLQATGS